MGTNCAPLLADLFLYSYENEFLDKLIKEGKRKLARRFNLSYRYIDDLISFNNKRFKEFISDIYPKELTIYSYVKDNEKGGKTAKGIKKNVIKNNIKHED